jgi:hypothetical protein
VGSVCARYRESMDSPEHCRHEEVDVTATSRSLVGAEGRPQPADRVDEVGICLLCERRVKRCQRAGEWSPWELDA